VTTTQTRPPALIVIGGFAGTGKSTLSRRLAAELRMPRLGSDSIGRTIRASKALDGHDVNAYWIAYELLFHLADGFLQAGVSTILDLNMGWVFQWQELDALRLRHPTAICLPIILTCPKELCLKRIGQRYATNPDRYDPPELFVTDPKIVALWEYLEHLDRPDAHRIDVTGSEDCVYAGIRRHLDQRLSSAP
jgi:predicted kinase